MERFCSELKWMLCWAMCVCSGQLLADTQVSVVGLFTGKAVLVVNNGKPQTVAAGHVTPEGVKLVSADSIKAVLEVGGKRRELGMGQGVSLGGAIHGSDGQDGSMKLFADERGHFYGNANINGAGSIKFVVDTGATAISMTREDAKRLNIDYAVGDEVQTSTANGVSSCFIVSVNTVKLGGITLNQVQACVGDGLPSGMMLLGMSALNRLDMKREGSVMTLTKKY